MSMQVYIYAAIALVIGIGCIACAGNRPYRTNLSPCDTSVNGQKCADAVVETTVDYKLGFVEFDDQGWFWDRKQLDAVEQMLRDEAHLTTGTNAEGIVVVLFVHGWKNNAAYDNGNVQMFRTTLAQLNISEKAESETDHRPSRRIVGVYAGWRGLSATIEPFKELSFWERKNTAHKVGYGALTEMLLDLEGLRTAINKAIPADSPKSELIIIGHSFGGAAVYSSTTQIMTERFINTTVEHNRIVRPFGDLVILLNPAFEAARYNNLQELAASVTNFPTGQRPVLGIFTSKADCATKRFFPLGRFFSCLFENYRKDKDQRKADQTAIGHYEPFITHDLVYDAKIKATTTQHSTFDLQTQRHTLHDEDHLKQSIANVHSLRDQWSASTGMGLQQQPARTYSFDDCELKPRKNYRQGDPFLVVYVDKQIIHDHSDITNPVLINFLREFIQFARTNPMHHTD